MDRSWLDSLEKHLESSDNIGAIDDRASKVSDPENGLEKSGKSG